MRITFISLFRRGRGGGAGRVAHEMAHCFAAQHDVVLICPADNTGLCQDETGLKVFGIQSASEGDFSVPSLSQRNVSLLFDFLNEFQPDIVHAHEPALLGLIGQIWAKMHNVPFVHTAHVLPTKTLRFGADDAAKILSNSLAEALIKPFIANFFENCDGVIALNRSAVDDVREFGYRGKVLMIPNGRDLKRYEACSYADISAEEKILTFIGYISHRKNQLYLLEVLRHLPKNYRLHITGELLAPDYGQQLKAFIREHRLENVVFTGQVAHEDIPSYLEKTHVFVSASKMEVQSLVIIEALGAGTPVVGLSNETIDELIDEKVGLRLPATADPKAFAQCVQQICSLSQSKYEAMCQRARDRVRHYDWANIRDLTIEAYESLLAESTLVERRQGRRITNIIALMPSEEVREVLTKKFIALDRILREDANLDATSQVATKIQKVKKVSTSTWVSLGLTMLISVLVYLILKPVNFLSRSEKLAD